MWPKIKRLNPKTGIRQTKNKGNEMKYIGVKIIEATAMTRGDYNTFRGWLLPENENGDDLGFMTDNGKGHIQWSPKETFESEYFPMTDSDGSKISSTMVDAFVGEVESNQLDEKTTHVKANMLTGFVQHEVSSCVDPNNYDHKIGTDIASNRIKDTAWKCLGFVLQWGRCGLNGKIGGVEGIHAV